MNRKCNIIIYKIKNHNTAKFCRVNNSSSKANLFENSNSSQRSLSGSNNKSGSSDNFSFMCSDNSSDKSNSETEVLFKLDSGATNHNVNDDTLFVKSITLKEPIKIKIYKRNMFVYATKVGTIVCWSEMGKKCTTNNVFYSEEFPTNLLSIRKLTQAGINVTFDTQGNAKLVCEETGELVNYSKSSDQQLYNVRFFLKDYSKSYINESDDNINLWHARLGHLNFGIMKKMSKAHIIGDVCQGTDSRPQTEISH